MHVHQLDDNVLRIDFKRWRVQCCILKASNVYFVNASSGSYTFSWKWRICKLLLKYLPPNTDIAKHNEHASCHGIERQSQRELFSLKWGMQNIQYALKCTFLVIFITSESLGCLAPNEAPREVVHSGQCIRRQLFQLALACRRLCKTKAFLKWVTEN